MGLFALFDALAKPEAVMPTPVQSPMQLGMIGGVRAPEQFWQGLDSSGLAHAANPDYRDYSQLYREYTFDAKPGYVPIGERDGKPVYAAPDYSRDDTGNYIPVSAADYQRLAQERGALIPTRDEVKALYGQATPVVMPTMDPAQSDPVAYTSAVTRAMQGIDGPVMHGKEFYAAGGAAASTNPSGMETRGRSPSIPYDPAYVNRDPNRPVGDASGFVRNAGNPMADGIIETAKALGMDPLVLATIISYETGGTFDPRQPGPTTQWGQHRGLIQFGEPQARQYGVNWDDPLNSQLGPDGAVARYFKSNGWQPGMGALDAYSIVNAGGPGRYNASDANNGGAPGTVRDKVERQFGPHYAKAAALLGGEYTPPETSYASTPSGGGTERMSTMNEPAGSFLMSPKDESGERSYLGGWLTPDRRDRLLMALQAMTLNPNQGLIAAASDRMSQRRGDKKEQEKLNATMRFLQSQPDGQKYVEVASAFGPAAAFSLWQEDQKPSAAPDPYTDAGKAAADLQNGLITQEQYDAITAGGGAEPMSPKDLAGVESTLRDDTTKALDPYQQRLAGQNIIEAAARNEGGVNDVALVTAFAKVLDPTSVVREGEFATIQGASGIPSAWKQELLNVLQNQKQLNPELRREIIALSTEIYNQTAEEAQGALGNARANAERVGANPQNIYWGQDPYTIEGRPSGSPLSEIRPQANPSRRPMQGPPQAGVPTKADVARAVSSMTPQQKALFDNLPDAAAKVDFLMSQGLL